jgi:hypothetical protein
MRRRVGWRRGERLGLFCLVLDFVVTPCFFLASFFYGGGGTLYIDIRERMGSFLDLLMDSQ